MRFFYRFVRCNGFEDSRIPEVEHFLFNVKHFTGIPDPLTPYDLTHTIELSVDPESAHENSLFQERRRTSPDEKDT